MNTLTALDLHFLTIEFQELIGAKVEKVYQPEKHEFLIVVHVPNGGKRILRIGLPKYCFLTEIKGEVPEKPDQFCLVLRKYLGGARIRCIEQLEFERILKLTFEFKDAQFLLYVELFSKGNLVLCTAEGNIKAAWLQHKWKDRTIRGNIPYEYPKQPRNFLTLTKEDFSLLMADSDKESVVKVLALDLGLGGKYSEELCVRAGLDKNMRTLSPEEQGRLYAEIEALRNQKIDSCIYSGEVTPVPMQSNPGECLHLPSFNIAVAQVMDLQIEGAQRAVHTEKHDREVRRLEKVIAEQEETISRLELAARESQRKAELIFEKYTTIQEILAELNKAKQKLSWKEIKDRLKDHPLIKEIHEKNKEVIIEL
jgi:predicted ribosome quality control (RQC) complex YloA/Tae2 family protein